MSSKLTDDEAYALSTPEERAAVDRYRGVQQRARLSGYTTETDMLIWSEAAGIIVKRNKRLGLIK